MTDLASLGMKIDSSQVKTGVNELDRLTAAGTKAEGAVDRLGDSASQTGKQVSGASAAAAEYAANAQRMARNATLGGSAMNEFGRSTGLARQHMVNLGFQIQDIGVQLASGANPLTVLAQQGTQIAGIMSQAEIGVLGLSRALGRILLPWTPLIAAIGAAGGAFMLFKSQVEDDAGLKAYTQSLGLTKKEMKELENVTITAGDVFTGLWRTIAERSGVDESIADFKTFLIDQFTQALVGAGNAMAGIYGEVVGTYRAITIIWSDLPAMFGAVFSKAVNAAIGLLENLINLSIAGVNKLAAGANSLVGFKLFGDMADVELGRVKETTERTFSDIRGIIRDQVGGATAEAQAAMQDFGRDLRRNIIGAGEDRLDAQAAAIKDDRPDKAAKKARERKAALSEAEKAYRAALKAAQDFQNALVTETDKIGMSAVEMKRYDVAIAAATARKAASVAPTKAQAEALIAEAAAIELAGKTWERVFKDNQAAEFIKNRVEALELENSLIGKSAEQQAVLRAERELTDAGIERGTEAWTRYIAAVLGAVEAEQRFAGVDRIAEDMSLLADHASATAQIMADAFGNVGSVFGDLVASLADYQAEQAHWAAEVARDATKQGQAEKSLATLRMQNTAAAISGIKGLFKEHSTAYKVMQAVEAAYAVFKIANTIRAIAADSAQTSTSIANSAARGAADQAAGGAKIFSQLGVFAFPVVAAMVAVLAGLGLGRGGGGGSAPSIPTAEDIQAGAGTGTVLGDPKAKSDSIARSLEIVADNTNKDLQYTNAMLTALRSIDTSIAKMAGTVARQVQISGSLFDTSGLGLGTSSKSGFLGLFGSTTTRNLHDLGIELASASVADIIANGISGNSYQVVQKIKKSNGFLGIGGGTKTTYTTTTGALDGDIADAIQGVILSLRNGLVAAADVMGLEGAQAILDSFTVSIGKISFKDMTGEQIEDQLNAIFSSIGDQMAGKLMPSLRSLQLVGEGLFETFIRVAKEYEAVEFALESIGRTFGMVGVESVAARSALVQLFGGLEEFLEGTEFFRDQFLTEAQQIAPVQAAVIAEMQRLGLSGISTREQFRDAVLGLDLTTAAGRELYASLLNVAPAFDKVLDYFDEINETSKDALESTVERFTAFAESLKKYRDTLFATEATQGNAYQVLRQRFLETAALAADGNATALGGLESAGKSFLDAARNNASTREQYLRDVAVVARGVDAGIFAAEETADYAQLQLDALLNATSILQQIADNTAPVSTPAGTAPAGSGEATPSPTETATLEELRELRSLTTEQAELIRRMERFFSRVEGEGMPVRTFEGEPLETQAAA